MRIGRRAVAPEPPVEARLFDLEWYSGEAGRDFADLTAAMEHYRSTGWRQQLSPHPLFDPRVVPDRPEGLTPFAAFVTDPDRWYRSPHASWDLAAYLLANPDAEDHPLGPLGHLDLNDDTVLDVVGLDGTVRRRWGDLRPRWAALANDWTAKRRLYPPDQVKAPERPELPPVGEILVSILLRVRDEGPTVRHKLEAVMQQTWPHWELVVVDEDSQDDTARIVEAYAARDPRVRLVDSFEEARGELLAFGDPTWDPEFVDGMVRAMTARKLDAAYGAAVVGDRYRRRFQHPTTLVVSRALHGRDVEPAYVPVLGPVVADSPADLDAEAAARLDLDREITEGMLSVVLVADSPRGVVEQVAALPRTDLVVVDCSGSRSLLARLTGALVSEERLTYVRIPRPATFEYAADLGFTHTSGEKVAFLGPGQSVDVERLAQHDLAQPVTVDEHGVIVTAGTVFSSDGAATPLLAGHVADELTGTFELPALDGQSFVTRAEDFIRAGGLDPRTGLVGYSQRIGRTPVVVGDLHVVGSTDRKQVRGEPTPEEFFAQWGYHVAEWRPEGAVLCRGGRHDEVVP